MENNKNEKRKVIAPKFSKYPKLALQLLEDEKRVREAMRKKYKKQNKENSKDRD